MLNLTVIFYLKMLNTTVKYFCKMLNMTVKYCQHYCSHTRARLGGIVDILRNKETKSVLYRQLGHFLFRSASAQITTILVIISFLSTLY